MSAYFNNHSSQSTIMKKLIVWFTFALLLQSCASHNAKPDPSFPEQTAQKLFEGALVNIAGQNYRLAAQKLEAIESRFPFGPYAEQAQLYLIYVYYKLGESATAISQADRFIRQHPRHPNVDYAYYMKGKVNFMAELSALQRLFAAPVDERDAQSARQAFRDFAELLKRFPNSRYAEDARRRMIFLRDRLAAYEIHVARHYMQRKAYVAAANRAKYVIEHYPRTSVTPAALAMLYAAYKQLGLDEQAEHARLTLKFNYPDYPIAD